MMDRDSEKVLQLLKEFDGICKDNDIKYYLTGETLLYAFCHGTIEPKAINAKVLMTVDNAKKFINVIQKNKTENREIEYWGNSRKYPDFSIKYTAADTLCFNVLEKLDFKTHGFHIRIGILRGKVKAKRLKRMMVNALVLGLGAWSHNESLVPYIKGAKKTAIAMMITKPAELLIGAGRLRKWLFNYLCSHAKNGNYSDRGAHPVWHVTYAKNKKADISALYFDGEETCTIEGMEFPAPKYTYNYLKRVTPGRIIETEEGFDAVDRFGFRTNYIVDTEIPYKEYFAKVENSKAAFKRVYGHKLKSEVSRIKNRKHNKLANQNWLAVQQTDHRFKLGEKYLPLKEDIKKMHAAKDYKELETVFIEYTEALDLMLAKKKSFAFDRELLDIYIDLLTHKGEMNKVEAILRYMPRTHTEPITFFEKDC